VTAETQAVTPPVSQADRETLLSVGRRDWATWPRYESAVLGFRDYWYPVLWSNDVGHKPRALTLMGERIMLMRERGKLYALHDRCPHRGVPLSMGRQEFPGTLSCCYHGWTFDLQNGRLVAAITDGPDSPICGKVAVKTYPVEERLGLIWVFMGDGPPPPVESDIPDELLAAAADGRLTRVGRISVRQGNWRLAAENGFDEGHAKFLHRNAVWTFMRLMPVWTQVRTVPTEDGKWITNVHDAAFFSSDFPGLGSWPPHHWWKRRPKYRIRISIRLPGALRVEWPRFWHYEWYVPQDAEHHRYIQMAVQFSSGAHASLFKLQYWSYIRWLFHGLFNDQDLLVVRTMDSPPERLYRPDVSIIGWRNLCEHPRGAVPK
jgi:phenylpropionate dioxygenase-like ring-hydroxylating dioxygenase large terminal subunit